MFFNLKAKTLAPEVLETIRIESPVRQTAKHTVTLENPFKGALQIQILLGIFLSNIREDVFSKFSSEILKCRKSLDLS